MYGYMLIDGWLCFVEKFYLRLMISTEICFEKNCFYRSFRCIEMKYEKYWHKLIIYFFFWYFD